MTSTLLLKLSGPMQSWGHQGRHDTRSTGSTPTKSGVLGLIAAAEGRDRESPLDDLAQLTFAVRVDHPGHLLRDYQTAQSWQSSGKVNTSLVTRYFLQDAVFVAAIESDDRNQLEAFREALTRPIYPLFLGRRSCPANWDLVIGIVDTDAVAALHATPWMVSNAVRKEAPTSVVLPIYRDGHAGEEGERRQDVPVSFSQDHRKYGWRTVVEHDDPALKSNDLGTDTRDPFFDTVVNA